MSNNSSLHWFVMRDLKRANAKLPAYKMLADMGFEIFTPMRWKLSVRGGRKVRKEVPVITDLLFVHDSRQRLDPVVERTPTLQYRYMRHGWCEPMTVRDEDMERFIRVVKSSDRVRYYAPSEVTPEMYGRCIRIVGGPLDGMEGRLLTIRGSKRRRLMVELPDLLIAGTEVNPEYIQLI